MEMNEECNVGEWDLAMKEEFNLGVRVWIIMISLICRNGLRKYIGGCVYGDCDDDAIYTPHVFSNS